MRTELLFSSAKTKQMRNFQGRAAGVQASHLYAKRLQSGVSRPLVVRDFCFPTLNGRVILSGLRWPPLKVPRDIRTGYAFDGPGSINASLKRVPAASVDHGNRQQRG